MDPKNKHHLLPDHGIVSSSHGQRGEADPHGKVSFEGECSQLLATLHPFSEISVAYSLTSWASWAMKDRCVSHSSGYDNGWHRPI